MSLIRTSIESNVARIVLCRSDKRNALSRQLLTELNSAVTDALNNPQTRVLVLEAEGSVFCAGMDLGEMQQRATSENGREEWQKDSKDYCELLISLYSATVPTIAVLQGPVLAGGVGMILACDFVIAAEGAFVSLPEPQRGITAAMVTPLLVHRIGAGPAAALLLSGDRMTVTRAAQQLATSIMKGSPQALATTKQHVDRIAGGNMAEKLRDSIEVSAAARATDDAREGLAAFLEKRAPGWQTSDS